MYKKFSYLVMCGLILPLLMACSPKKEAALAPSDLEYSFVILSDKGLQPLTQEGAAFSAKETLTWADQQALVADTFMEGPSAYHILTQGNAKKHIDPAWVKIDKASHAIETETGVIGNATLYAEGDDGFLYFISKENYINKMDENYNFYNQAALRVGSDTQISAMLYKDEMIYVLVNTLEATTGLYIHNLWIYDSDTLELEEDILLAPSYGAYEKMVADGDFFYMISEYEGKDELGNPGAGRSINVFNLQTRGEFRLETAQGYPNQIYIDSANKKLLIGYNQDLIPNQTYTVYDTQTWISSGLEFPEYGYISQEAKASIFQTDNHFDFLFYDKLVRYNAQTGEVGHISTSSLGLAPTDTAILLYK